MTVFVKTKETVFIETIAALCHDANARYCKSIGDTSQVCWEDAPDWQKESAINGVKFAIANPQVTPRQMHGNWLDDKRADGWKYGPMKNAETKTHPCFVEYDQLPASQQEKDDIFLGIVNRLRGCTGE